MARYDTMSNWYDIARKRMRPGWKRLRKMDRDDWLHSIGLERRNVAADVAGAAGFALFGCAIGFGLGMLLAPRNGAETRERIATKVRNYTQQKTGSSDTEPASAPSWHN